jgi:hypothetical protein
MSFQKTAVITGASSGTGAAFAKKLAARGYDLILIARRKNLLESLCNELETKYKIKAEYFIADLSVLEEVISVEEKIKTIDNLEILINNAGFGINNNFHESSIDEQVKMIQVHNVAVIKLTYSALPFMLKQRRGFIINVSSLAAFLISPENNLYCSTKAFINTFTESLHLELAGTGIKVQALCPGFTLTEFHQKLGYEIDDPIFKKFMSAEYVVDYSLRDLEENKVISIPGFKYKLIKLVPFIPRKLLYKTILMSYKFFTKRKN